MAEPDIARVKRNVAKMIDQGAPETDIDAYVAGEGMTPDALRAAGKVDTSYTGALTKGASDVVEGVGKTVKNFIDSDTGKAIEAKGQKVEPKNYKSATDEFMNRGGEWYDKNWSAAPRALVEQAPGMAVDVLGGLVGKKLGGPVGALAGTGLSYLLRSRGDAAESNAAYRTGDPNAQPTTEDKVRSVVTGIPEAAINAVGARGLVSPAKVATTGLRGAVDAAGNLLKTVGAEGAAGAGSNVVSQVGQTVGTDKGLKVDPGEVFGSGVLSAGTAAGLRTPHALGDVNNARRFRDFDNEASQRVATRIEGNADGDLSNVKTARKAVGAAETDIKSDLTHAFSSDPDAKARIDANDTARRALDRFNAGEQVTDGDLASIASATKGSSAGDRIASLTSEAVALRKLKQMGSYDDTSFKGGLSAKLEKSVRAIYNPVGAGVGALLAGAGLTQPALAMGVLTAAPKAVAAGWGGYLAAKALDKATGYRSPADTFVRKFGGTNAVTPAVTPDVREQQRPTGPLVPQAQTFNGKAIVPPFGTQPVATPTDLARRDGRLTKAVDSALTRGVTQQNAEDARMDASVDRGADFVGRNAIAQLRAERRIQAMKDRQAAQQENQGLRELKSDATGLVQARNANLKVMQQDATQTVQAKRANDALQRRGDTEQKADARELMAARQSPNALDRAQAGDARELMAARRAHEKLQREAEAAASEAEGARQEVGTDGQITPDTLKAAQKLVKSLTAVQKITAKVEKGQEQIAKKEAAQAKATERAQAKAEREAVKAAKATAKVNGTTATLALKPRKVIGDTHVFDLEGNGKKGEARIKISGNTAEIDSINHPDLSNGLGTSRVRDVLRQFQSLHPEVQELTGTRTTGARSGGSENFAGSDVSVKLPKREKANGNGEHKAFDDYPDAPWSYEPSKKAAEMAYQFAKDNGATISNPDGYKRGTAKRIDAIMETFGKLAKETGDGNLEAAMNKMLAVRSESDARNFREVLKDKMPSLAHAIDAHLTDGWIKQTWTPQRSKLH